MQKISRFMVSVGILLSVSACATGQGNIVGLGEDALEIAEQSGATTHGIFFATTRLRSEDSREFFSGERIGEMSVGTVKVSIPRTHKVGQIERPPSGISDPERHFAVGTPELFSGTGDFQRGINDALAKKGVQGQNVLVFVHGYNTNFSSALLRISQFVHDTGFDGVPVLFSWASRGKTIDYVYDLNSALQARLYLQELAIALAGTKARNFGIVAHSMGNLVTLEAMAALEARPDFKPRGNLRGIILAAPDVDFDLFVEHLKAIKALKPYIHVLVSKDDRALAISKRVAGGLSRVGASDPERLAALGLKVLDLSEIDDKSSANHSKFADSPAIVQLIGRGIKEGNNLSASTTTSPPPRTLVGSVFKSFTAIPSAAADNVSGGVLRVAN